MLKLGFLHEMVEGTQLPHGARGAAKAAAQPGGVGGAGQGTAGDEPTRPALGFPERSRAHEGSALSSPHLKVHQNHARIADAEVFSYPCKDRS